MPWDNFTPNEMDERQKDFLLEEGYYDIKIAKCVERKSKSDNNMFEISIEIINPKGKNRNVFEYILHDQKWIHKLKTVCDCLDMSEQYNKGSVSSSDFETKSGRAEVERFYDKNKDINGNDYGWKNKITKYIPFGDSSPDESQPEKGFDDDIPF